MLPSPTSTKMRRISPPNLKLCRPRTMAVSFKHAERAAVFGDVLRTGERDEPGNGELRRRWGPLARELRSEAL